MRVLPQAQEVRRLVQHVFDQLGIDDAEASDVNETILINDGAYRGRSYQIDGYFAMWLIDAGLLQFYDDDGNMLRTVKLFSEKEPEKMAA